MSTLFSLNSLVFSTMCIYICNFADASVYKNISLLKTTTIALRPTIAKRRNGHLLTEEIFIDPFVNHARTYYDKCVSSISHDTRSNLLTNQQTALKDLSSNNDIVIKEAYNGGAITVIFKEDYITDCNNLSKITAHTIRRSPT